MKAGLFVTFLALSLGSQLMAQDKCSSLTYYQQELQKDPQLAEQVRAIEQFTQQQIQSAGRQTGRIEGSIIKIPVVVHVLYHTPDQKISNEKVISQIDALNRYFRRKNGDTLNTPEHFRRLAADCEIEFQLATSDPRRRSTTGIVRKYTPITKWVADDQMKFAASMGDDAWDSKSYLNIWVCNLDKFAGYASSPGGNEAKDGIVISYKAFGTGGTAGYDQGKTAVHEVGHWLNLKHIWGDANCGDDGVGDTPQQASYTMGCPGNVRITCGNGPYGDMYMNYMDLTNDACINMFTEGQKARMRALFAPGGARDGILVSKGLNSPLIFESPIPVEDPRWLQIKLYPNPAFTVINLDFSYDIRWIGKNIFVTNSMGQNVMNVSITSKNMQINVAHLAPGIYFLAAKKDDGESMKERFMKL